jgi:AcrR family transcriptional regulator
MAYEVIKTIKGREYRYSVESYREPESGRVKNRWTYVGKVGKAQPKVKRRTLTSQTRQRLLDAFLRLVDRKPWAEISPSSIAIEAGLAHGTFYRYFKSRMQLFSECTRGANAALDERLSDLASLADTLGDERIRLRAWVIDLVKRPTAPPGLLRAWMDIDVTKLRAARRTARVDAFVAYIESLRERGYVASIGDARPLAIALSFLVETLGRRTIAEQVLLSEDDYAAACEAFDRLLFWQPPPNGGSRS